MNDGCADPGSPNWKISGLAWTSGDGVLVNVSWNQGYNGLAEKACDEVAIRGFDASGQRDDGLRAVDGCPLGEVCVAGAYGADFKTVEFKEPDGTVVRVGGDIGNGFVERFGPTDAVVYRRELPIVPLLGWLTDERNDIIYASMLSAGNDSVARLDLTTGNVVWSVALTDAGHLK